MPILELTDAEAHYLAELTAEVGGEGPLMALNNSVADKLEDIGFTYDEDADFFINHPFAGFSVRKDADPAWAQGVSDGEEE